MDARVEEVRPPLLPSRLPWRRAAADGKQAGATRSHAAATAAAGAVRLEWAVAMVALFVLGRLVVLFFRRHLSGMFGGGPGDLWQDDLVVTLTFAVVELLAIGAAVWRARASALLRQPVLLLVLGWAWLTTAWSVEPAVSVRRVLLFVGAAGVGWFIGDRFTIRDHMRLLSMLGGVAAATTVLGLVFWNEAARSTNGDPRQWSGVYVNRNALGLVLAMGLLATLLLVRSVDDGEEGSRRRRNLLRGYAFVLFLFLGATRSRTPLLAVGLAFAVAWITGEIRRSRGSALRMGAAAYVVFATLATIGLVIHWYWYDIVRFFGREPDLTGRTLIWQLVQWFGDFRPWTGWGFEAIWANPHAIGQAQAAHGSLRAPVVGGWPFSAHSGYYELLLGVGRVGLLLMVVFLGSLVWRAFRHAWLGSDGVGLWPLAFVVFVLVMNFSESLFVSSEAVWTMTVATAIALTEHDHREGTSVPLFDRARDLLAFRLR